jgi:predicted MFS family arabinose efflux permease
MRTADASNEAMFVTDGELPLVVAVETAVQIISEVRRLSDPDAVELITARVRAIHQAGITAGATLAQIAVQQAFAPKEKP